MDKSSKNFLHNFNTCVMIEQIEKNYTGEK